MNCIATSSTPQLPWPRNCWRERPTCTSAGQLSNPLRAFLMTLVSIPRSTPPHTRKCWNSRRPLEEPCIPDKRTSLLPSCGKTPRWCPSSLPVTRAIGDKRLDFLQRNIKGQGERRATKKCVRAPPQAVAYTKHMGGVDRHDQHRSYQSCSRQSMKWWRKILYFLIDVSRVNAWLCYKNNTQRVRQTTEPQDLHSGGWPTP